MFRSPRSSAADRRPGRRTTAFALTTLAAAGVLTLSTSAAAAPLPGSTFDATDGKLDTNGTITAVDDRPSGQSDDGYRGGSKENTQCPGVWMHKSPPHKDDLLKLYGGSEGSVVYLAWTRAPRGQGTATLSFELNQSSTACGNGVQAVRTPGDLLFGYDFRGGNTMGVSVRMWNGSDWGSPISLPANVAQSSVSGDVLFGELAIDIDGIPGIGTGANCVTFASGFARSRASTSFQSQLKDVIRGVPLAVSTCPTRILRIDLAKAVDANGDGDFHVAEISNGSPLEYRISFQNISAVPVKVVSVVDTVNGAATAVCPSLIGDVVNPSDDSELCDFAGGTPPAGTMWTSTAVVTVSEVGNPANTGAASAQADASTPPTPADPINNSTKLKVIHVLDANGDSVFTDFEHALAPGAPVTYRVQVINDHAYAVNLDAIVHTVGLTTTAVCASLLGPAAQLDPGESSAVCQYNATSPPPGKTVIDVLDVTVSQVGAVPPNAARIHRAPVLITPLP
jgi:hypothetical protein